MHVLLLLLRRGRRCGVWVALLGAHRRGLHHRLWAGHIYNGLCAGGLRLQEGGGRLTDGRSRGGDVNLHAWGVEMQAWAWVRQAGAACRCHMLLILSVVLCGWA